jgi:hypothetical protein
MPSARPPVCPLRQRLLLHLLRPARGKLLLQFGRPELQLQSWPARRPNRIPVLHAPRPTRFLPQQPAIDRALLSGEQRAGSALSETGVEDDPARNSATQCDNWNCVKGFTPTSRQRRTEAPGRLVLLVGHSAGKKTREAGAYSLPGMALASATESQVTRPVASRIAVSNESQIGCERRAINGSQHRSRASSLYASSTKLYDPPTLPKMRTRRFPLTSVITRSSVSMLRHAHRWELWACHPPSCESCHEGDADERPASRLRDHLDRQVVV